jgi:hypothetical protein
MPISRKGPLEPTESVIDRNDSGDDSGMSRRLKRVERLVPQPHGGAIKQGGNNGNRGGTGAVPSEIRERLRGSFAERIRVLEDIADHGRNDTDRIRAIELMGRYGLGVADRLEVQAETRATAQIIYLPRLGHEGPITIEPLPDG